MGCHSSKFVEVDDSIHVMLHHHAHDKSSSGYVPRQPHPLLVQKSPSSALTIVETDAEESSEDAFLLFHTAHHNDTIDPRDLAEYGSMSEREQVKSSS